MDFVSDALFDGRRLRALTGVDTYTRDALVIDVAQGIMGERVVEAMMRLRLPGERRAPFARIMVPSLSRRRWIAELMKTVRSWTSRVRAIRPTTPLSNHSMGDCGTNAWTRIGSCRWTMSGARSRRGDGTAMSGVLTPCLAGRHQIKAGD